MKTYRILSLNRLIDYVKENNKPGHYYGYYDRGILKGRKCDVLFKTSDNFESHCFINDYMKFYVYED